jgi:hypothetical protein
MCVCVCLCVYRCVCVCVYRMYTWSRGLGRRIHGSVEDTKLSTNKQHTLCVCVCVCVLCVFRYIYVGGIIYVHLCVGGIHTHTQV